jgi:hypothetical protein
MDRLAPPEQISSDRGYRRETKPLNLIVITDGGESAAQHALIISVCEACHPAQVKCQCLVGNAPDSDLESVIVACAKQVGKFYFQAEKSLTGLHIPLLKLGSNCYRLDMT